MNQQNGQLIALIDENDNIIGYDEKLKVHEEGKLHRAFSIFVYNKMGEILIHKRAHEKYHSPGLWTNTCCSHLLENMSMDECTHDRLKFEMGFDTKLEYQFKFTYKETFGNGLTEYETDHVYFGHWEGSPKFNPKEVAEYKWVSLDFLINDIEKNADKYTYWFKYILKNYKTNLQV